MIKWTLIAALLLVAAPAAATTTGDQPSEPSEAEGVADADEAGGDEALADVEADVDLAEDEGDEEDDEDEGFELPVSLSGGVSISTSLGAISRPNHQTSDTVRSSWSFGVGYDITEELGISLGLGLSLPLTPYSETIALVPEDADYTDGETPERTPHQARFNDISLSLGYAPVYVIPRADIRISAGLGGTIPTSVYSRNDTLRTAISPSLSFSRSFGEFSLSYGLSASKNFHRFTHPVQDPDELDLIFREGGAEQQAQGLVAEGGLSLSEWSMGHNVSASYTWFEGFRTSLGWGFGSAWGYIPSPKDELSSEHARSGRIARQSMTGSITASYSFLDHFSTSLGMSTGGPPKTADNRRIRFPFFDTQSGNLQYTSVRWGFNVSY